MNPLLHIHSEDGGIDIHRTKESILREFPDLDAFPLERLIRAVETALTDVRPNIQKRPQYVWLFLLAGRLKGAFNPEQQQDEETALAVSPLVWLFAELLIHEGLVGSKNRIDWNDTEAVQIEWLNAWCARKLPVGSSALSDAYEQAKLNPLELTGNRYLILIVNIGFALQIHNGNFPFILPVNGKTASLLGTTVPTIASSVSKAIRDGYFIVEDPKYSPSARKARMFRFNFDHPRLATNTLVQSQRPALETSNTS